MGDCCDLEVDINGEETFMLNKNILSSFSRKFSNLFGNLVETKDVCLKVIFNDFPGGAHAFELIVRLCYSSRSSSCSMELSPSNMALLCSAANFLEMDHDATETPSLKPHIEKFLEGIRFWTWCELLEALKQCQLDLFSSKSYAAIVDRIVDQLVEKLALPSVTSPYTCSSNRSSFQFSCDSSSYSSWRNNSSGATWWFEDLLFLKVYLMEKVTRTMISHDFDHGVVSKFLFCYHKSTCLGAGAAQAEKIEATKVVINLLSLLDMRSISCKDLFNLNRIATSLKIRRDKIEHLIGPLLDQATIDYLLLPSPHGLNHAYDVDFVLRLIHIFFFGSNFELTSNQHKRVVKMMDMFLGEVAPDPNLKPSEFEALITVLPDTARESHDQLYMAIDMYLKVHAGLGEKEKMSICSALNYQKLSSEFLRHLTRNLVFPSEAKPRANVTRQSRMKSLLQENDHLKNLFDSMFHRSFKNTDVKEDHEELMLSNEVGDLKERQRGTQLASVKKSGIHIMSNAMYLPKLCS